MAQLYYTPFVVASGQVPSTQTNFPAVILPGNDARFKTTGNGGHVASSSGYDLRPYSDSALTTALTYELVWFDGINGNFEMYVQIASLADGSTVYLGYGDTSLTSDGSSTGTWDTNFKGVWHFGTSSTLTLTDSTSNANTLTNTGSTPAASGKLGGAPSFNGTSQRLSVADNASLSITGDITITAWVNVTTIENGDGLTGKGANEWRLLFYDDGTGTRMKPRWIRNGAGYVSTNGVGTAAWKHVGAVASGTSGTSYLDGATNGTGTLGTATDSASQVDVAALDGSANLLNGLIDELRISATARATNWITTEYNNMSAPTTFWPTGTEVTVGAGAGVRIGGLLPILGVQ